MGIHTVEACDLDGCWIRVQLRNTLGKTDAGFVQRGYLSLKDLKEKKKK